MSEFKIMNDWIKELLKKEALYEDYTTGAEEKAKTKKEEQKKLVESFIPEPVSVRPLQPRQNVGQMEGGSQEEQQRILEAVGRRSQPTETVPEYDYNLTMPEKPKSRDISAIERNITGRNSAGAAIPTTVSPEAQTEQALKRLMQRRGY